MHQAVKLNRDHQVQVLPMLSEEEQLQFLASSTLLRRALSMTLAGPVDQENILRSASWIVNSKGVAQQAVAERTLLARDAQTPEAKSLLKQLTDIRRELSKLSTGFPPAGQEESWKKRRQEWTEKERLLSAQLGQHDLRTLRDDPWIDLDEVTRRLPEKSALVDIVRFRVFDYKAPPRRKKWRAAHYVAWVTRKDGQAHLFDLGEADPIDALIAQVRHELEEAPYQLRKEGEVKAEQAAQRALQALAAKVLQPLRKDLDDCPFWIVSPDGNLWLVPWAALPLDEKTYAIEKHTIGYVISGRDLVIDPLKLDRKPGRPLVVADPDYDLGVDEATRLARQTMAPPASGQRSLPEALKLGLIPRLPFTATEGRAVADRLREYGLGVPSLLTGSNALAEKVRTARSPRILVLATHGFFLPEPEASTTEREGMGEDAENRALPPSENPLLRLWTPAGGLQSRGRGGREKAPHGGPDRPGRGEHGPARDGVSGAQCL